MFRYLAVGVIVLGWAGWGIGTTLHETKPQPLALSPFSSDTVKADFAGGGVARAICIGDGRTYVGLYVFDIHGNCVARDDLNHVQARDDLHVEWFPTADAPYQVEVVNFGNMLNSCMLALK